MRTSSGTAARAPIQLAHRRYELANGLRVVVHEDHAAPVVAVYVAYHVGSAREEAGRSGFAHLFEHMLFQGSLHVGSDEHFKRISEAGGTLNGTTAFDRTLYFETLPANQLELALWLESDRMGFLLPAMTQAKLANQRDVVKNERRQNYENRPYGLVRETLAAELFPAGHPYHTIPIGSEADLDSATLDDVADFFRRWYVPNNAVLAIGGDVEPERALELVERWFGPIPRGPDVLAPPRRPAALAREKRVLLEDPLAKLPQIVLAWPGTERWSRDDPALHLLAMVLSQNRSAVLDRALTVDAVLAREVSAFNASYEIAGEFGIAATAAPGVSLDELRARIDGLLVGLLRNGIDPAQLERMKTRSHSDALRMLETVSSRTEMLVESELYTGDPGRCLVELERPLEVTPEEVAAVLERYVAARARVVLSAVPAGRRELAVWGSRPAGEGEAPPERTRRPPPDPRPAFRTPLLWRGALANGVPIVGTPYGVPPMSALALHLPAGRMREPMHALGIASLAASLAGEGTARLSTIELCDELDRLGMNLHVRADDDEITVAISVLDEHLAEAARILAEVVIEPRFDPADFTRLKKQRLIEIDTRGESIQRVALNAWRRLLRGERSPLGWPDTGTRETLERLELEDVRAYWRAHAVPGGARLVAATNLAPARLCELLEPLAERWLPQAPPPAPPEAIPPEGAGLFLVDRPGVAQSELRIGHLAVSSLDPDYFPLQVLNYVLGGAFNSRINMNLREDKGYTYGAHTSFEGGLRPGPFVAATAVHTRFTRESVVELVREIEAIRDGVREDELAFARQSMTQAALRQYESAASRLQLADNVSKYGWPDDYPERRLALLDVLTSADLRALAERHVRPGALRVLVAGDAEEVGAGLAELPLGPPVELDIDGAPLVAARARVAE
jgi:zinc protease